MPHRAPCWLPSAGAAEHEPTLLTIGRAQAWMAWAINATLAVDVVLICLAHALGEPRLLTVVALGGTPLGVMASGVLGPERQRLMRDIHDGVGSQLVGLLQLGNQPQPSPQALRAQVLIALDETRMAVAALHPAHNNWSPCWPPCAGACSRACGPPASP